MPTVVINSGKTGRIERSFANEGELAAYIIDWCVQHDEHISGDVRLLDDLFGMKAGSTYHIEAGPSGDADGEGYYRLELLG